MFQTSFVVICSLQRSQYKLEEIENNILCGSVCVMWKKSIISLLSFLCIDIHCFLRHQIRPVGLHSDILVLCWPFPQHLQNNYFFLGGLTHSMRETILYSKKAPKNPEVIWKEIAFIQRCWEEHCNNFKYYFPSYPSPNATQYCHKFLM